MDKNTLLIVDDAIINREMLKDIFIDKFNIIEASNGEEAIQILDEKKDEIALILLDLIMPKKTGLDVMHHMALNDMINYIPVIMITGESTVESDVKAYELGASDIIYKPFEPKVVIQRANNIIELFRHRISIEKELEIKTQELYESKKRIEQSNDFLINALSSVIEYRNLESGEHVQRVKDYTRILLKYLRVLYPEYSITDEQIELIVIASTLHDVGKIAIPDIVLLKPGRLTDEEYEEMKRHTTLGCELLEKFKQDENEFYNYCYNICRHHHEKYDGTGYPDKISGEDIPICAQVVAVADVFDALTSQRVYKPAFSFEEASRIINEGNGSAFSPKLVRCFNEASDEFRALANK